MKEESEMKETIGTMKDGHLTMTDSKLFPDSELLLPGEVTARGLMRWRDPNGDAVIGEGVFIQLIGADRERPDYRVETDKGNVLRIVAVDSQEEIPLGSELGGHIVSEYHRTEAWTHTDLTDLRFSKTGQPLTRNHVATVIPPLVGLIDSRDVRKAMAEVTVVGATVRSGNGTAAQKDSVIPVVQESEPPKVEEPVAQVAAAPVVAEVEVESEEPVKDESIVSPEVSSDRVDGHNIWIASTQEPAGIVYRLKISGSRSRARIVEIVEEESQVAIDSTSETGAAIIEEFMKTRKWTTKTNAPDLRYQLVPQPAPV